MIIHEISVKMPFCTQPPEMEFSDICNQHQKRFMMGFKAFPDCMQRVVSPQTKVFICLMIWDMVKILWIKVEK